MAILYASDFHKIEHKEKTPPKFDGRGVDGYGQRIATNRVVRLDGKGTWRRVYMTQISNAGSAFIEVKGTRLYIRDGELRDG